MIDKLCVEAIALIKIVQEKAYYGDISDSGSADGHNNAKNACYEIDMMCREYLDRLKATGIYRTA